MNKKITRALISVFYKNGLLPLVEELVAQNVEIYSTGGTYDFIVQNNFPCKKVEDLTQYPSILGGRVKTLHPKVFGGILGRLSNSSDVAEMQKYEIPEFNLVVIDLYPFEETVASTTDEKQIIEKIDIGGPSMIRAAAKNHAEVLVVSHVNQYEEVIQIIKNQKAETSLEQRLSFAAKAFDVCSNYDNAISNYFNKQEFVTAYNKPQNSLRYGENPHQQAVFYGNTNELFNQLHGKELSYNNLVDVDAALQLIIDVNNSNEFAQNVACAIIKHTNVCGLAIADTALNAWTKALSGDSESAFGGIIVFNSKIDIETAEAINSIFFEVLIAPDFDKDALEILQKKKNRILLKVIKYPEYKSQQKNLLNGVLIQQYDNIAHNEWKSVGGRPTTENEKIDLILANIACKHLKSNAIALVKDKALIGKGCGQTSRIDALKQSIEKAKQFNQILEGASLASDAFFPFDDCIKLAHETGISAIVQPGGSIRDEDSIIYAQQNNIALIITGTRHFKH